MERECVLCGGIFYGESEEDIVCEECISEYEENNDVGVRRYGTEEVG